jgi:hypothetical protein
MTTIRAFAIAASLFAASAAPAQAQLAPQSADIGGNVEQRLRVKNLIGTGIGVDVEGNAIQCAIFEGTRVGGNVHQNCEADNIIATAIGKGATANAIQGGIGVPKPRR